MEKLIVHPKDQHQLKAIKVILKASDIDFKKEESSPYNPEFVAKIKKSEKNFKEGKYTTIKVEDLWK